MEDFQQLQRPSPLAASKTVELRSSIKEAAGSFPAQERRWAPDSPTLPSTHSEGIRGVEAESEWEAEGEDPEEGAVEARSGEEKKVTSWNEKRKAKAERKKEIRQSSEMQEI